MKKQRQSKQATKTSSAGGEPEKRQDGAFYRWEGDVLVLNVLGTPSAKRDKIGKPKGTQLKISVTANPVAGRATDYMVKFLAKEFGVKTSDIEVVFGRMNINKQLRITHPTKFPRVFKGM